MFYLYSIIAVIIAYLFGSISSAIIVCKLAGLPDPRTEGSHNPGATNVLRIGGKMAAGVTLLGDVLKGFIPVAIANGYGFNTTLLAIVALAALMGHLFPIFFRFKGGKGVATMIGCLFALSWPTGLCWLTTWFIVALLFRYSSLAAIIASLSAPFYIGYFTQQRIYIFVMSLMSMLVIIRHHANIINIIKRKETKIGHRSSKNESLKP